MYKGIEKARKARLRLADSIDSNKKALDRHRQAALKAAAATEAATTAPVKEAKTKVTKATKEVTTKTTAVAKTVKATTSEEVLKNSTLSGNILFDIINT